MPVYRFRMLSGDQDDIELDLADDDAARAEANRALGDLLFDAATELRSTATHIEIWRQDGTLLAEVSARPAPRANK